MAAATSTFFGTTLPTKRSAQLGSAERKHVVTEAKFLRGVRPKKDLQKVKEGSKSQVKQAKKLLPYDQKLYDTWPKRSGKMDSARNQPRQGGFGGGGPYQRVNKNIPSAAGTKPLQGIDPLIYVGGLIGVFLALTLPTILSST